MCGNILDGLTEKEALWVYDYALDHTSFLPERPTLRRHKDGSEDFNIRVPGMGQERLWEILDQLRNPSVTIIR